MTFNFINIITVSNSIANFVYFSFPFSSTHTSLFEMNRLVLAFSSVFIIFRCMVYFCLGFSLCYKKWRKFIETRRFPFEFSFYSRRSQTTLIANEMSNSLQWNSSVESRCSSVLFWFSRSHYSWRGCIVIALKSTVWFFWLRINEILLNMWYRSNRSPGSIGFFRILCV